MNRIMVMGASAGAGKSTFARKLGEQLNINVYHLDALFWKPNWVQASLEEFSAAQEKITPKDQWIIEGNYSNTFDVRVNHADTIIYLDVPLAVCLYRVVKRWLLNIGKTRPDMGAGCKEKLDYPFVKFICTTYYPRRKKMRARLHAFKKINPQNTTIVLKGRKEINKFMEK